MCVLILWVDLSTCPALNHLLGVGRLSHVGVRLVRHHRLILLVFLPPGAGTLVLAVALGNAPLSYRQLRISWREQMRAAYVEASQSLGAAGWSFFRKTLWPNLWPDIAALARLVFALSALELSGLAFLGLMGDPDFPELGAMLRQYQPYRGSKFEIIMKAAPPSCGC